MVPFYRCDGKVAQKGSKSIMFIPVPRKVDNFCTEANKTSGNLGGNKFFANRGNVFHSLSTSLKPL